MPDMEAKGGNMGKLSANFSEVEFLRSATAERLGLSNTWVEGRHRLNARTLCRNFLEPLRKKLGNRPIVITSGYRTPLVNGAIGGSASSAHMSGRAVDFSVSGVSLADAFDTMLTLQAENIVPPFDQLIWEFGEWIHLGIHIRPRGQVLQALGRGRYGNIKRAPRQDRRGEP